MPSHTGTPNFPLTVDDAASLATGGTEISTTLAADLLIGDEESIFCDSVLGAQGGWTVVVDDETIYYGATYGANRLDDLARGQSGTVEADHFIGAPVTIYGPPRIDNPATKGAIIAIQGRLVDGASGTFTTVDLKTVTVVDGVITSIV